MAFTATIYKSGIPLGSGTVSGAGATSLTSYSATAGRRLGTGRNVQIAAGGGRVWNTRVTNDGGTTITIRDPSPYTS